MTSALASAPLLGEPLPVELMNTLWADRDGLHDALGSPADAGGWLRAVSDRGEVPAAELLGWLDAVSEGELNVVHQDLSELRDAARRLAARQTGDTREAALAAVDVTSAIAAVNLLAASAQAWPLLDWPEDAGPQASRISRSAPGPVFVADLARACVALLGGPTGDRLRACHGPGCVLYFIKQHPRREWCSPECGNRARQARHYRRHQQRR